MNCTSSDTHSQISRLQALQQLQRPNLFGGAHEQEKAVSQCLFCDQNRER